MSDDQHDRASDPVSDEEAFEETSEAVTAMAVTSDYKILGETDRDNGVAVLGQNNANTGTPIGVKGVVPNTGVGYGLDTPDDLRVGGDIEATADPLEIRVQGDNGMRLYADLSDGRGGSVTLGHESNSTFLSAGAVVGGGGFDDGSTSDPNQAAGGFPTISGGRDNLVQTVSNNYAVIGGGRGHRIAPNGEDSLYATIGGGQGNTIKETNSHVTIGGGVNNTATSGTDNSVIAGGRLHDIEGVKDATISGGERNAISGSGGNGTIGGGYNNELTGNAATIGGGYKNSAGGTSGGTNNDRNQTVAGGRENDASAAGATVGGGRDNRADGSYATVPGGNNCRAQADYAFAAGRRAKARNSGSFVWADSTNSDFESKAIDQFLIRAGNGVGIGTNSPSTQFHVQDFSGSDSSLTGHAALVEDTATNDARALAIRTGDSSPTGADNFITFFDDDNNPVGAIEGKSGTDINLNSGSADYAEYMPRLDPDEEIEAADVVGVVGDSVTRRTERADAAMVVTDQPIVTGNSPGVDPEDREDHETVAFVGQVPVKVRGTVSRGDLLVPSGAADGTAEAVDPGEWRPGDGSLVGRATEADDSEGVTEVSTIVGVDDPTLVGDRLREHRDRIEDLEAENDALRERLGSVEDRLTAVEPGQSDSPAPADD